MAEPAIDQARATHAAKKAQLQRYQQQLTDFKPTEVRPVPPEASERSPRDQVEALQSFLQQRGYYSQKVDGRWRGPGGQSFTQDALNRYLTDRNAEIAEAKRDPERRNAIETNVRQLTREVAREDPDFQDRKSAGTITTGVIGGGTGALTSAIQEFGLPVVGGGLRANDGATTQGANALRDFITSVDHDGSPASRQVYRSSYQAARDAGYLRGGRPLATYTPGGLALLGGIGGKAMANFVLNPDEDATHIVDTASTGGIAYGTAQLGSRAAFNMNAPDPVDGRARQAFYLARERGAEPQSANSLLRMFQGVPETYRSAPWEDLSRPQSVDGPNQQAPVRNALLQNGQGDFTSAEVNALRTGASSDMPSGPQTLPSSAPSAAQDAQEAALRKAQSDAMIQEAQRRQQIFEAQRQAEEQAMRQRYMQQAQQPPAPSQQNTQPPAPDMQAQQVQNPQPPTANIEPQQAQQQLPPQQQPPALPPPQAPVQASGDTAEMAALRQQLDAMRAAGRPQDAAMIQQLQQQLDTMGNQASQAQAERDALRQAQEAESARRQAARQQGGITLQANRGAQRLDDGIMDSPSKAILRAKAIDPNLATGAMGIGVKDTLAGENDRLVGLARTNPEGLMAEAAKAGVETSGKSIGLVLRDLMMKRTFLLPAGIAAGVAGLADDARAGGDGSVVPGADHMPQGASLTALPSRGDQALDYAGRAASALPRAAAETAGYAVNAPAMLARDAVNTADSLYQPSQAYLDDERHMRPGRIGREVDRAQIENNLRQAQAEDMRQRQELAARNRPIGANDIEAMDLGIRSDAARDPAMSQFMVNRGVPQSSLDSYALTSGQAGADDQAERQRKAQFEAALEDMAQKFKAHHAVMADVMRAQMPRNALTW